MSESLSQQTISGVFWSALERIGSLGIQFIITIIIARILTPGDYGLIGMLSIFTALGAVILDSGFGQALIRKKEVSQVDYCSVFYTNLVLGVLIYLVLFFCAPLIASFFHSPELKQVSRFVFLVFPINSLGLIHNTIINRNINFKILAKVSVLSALGSGVFGVFFAYLGFGVWTLVYQTILFYTFNTILLWIFNKWRPSLLFSFQAIKSLFAFSMSLMSTGVIIVVFNNIYTLIIGRYYPVAQVGFYSQAKRFQDLPTQTLTGVIQRVTFPVLSIIQDDALRLKAGYQRIIKLTIFLNTPIMLGLIVISHNLFLLLLTEKWLPAVPYFQLLCIYGVLFPLHSINVNILNVRGQGKILLTLEIIRRILLIVAIILTINHGVTILLIGYILSSLVSVLINMHVCGKQINLTLTEQIKDIFPYFLLSALTSYVMYRVGLAINIDLIFTIIIQTTVGIMIYLFLNKLLQLSAYKEIYKIIITKIWK